MTETIAAIRILIVDNDFSETSIIKTWLEKDMRVPWQMTHCVNVEEASDDINQYDLIILKPEIKGLFSPKEVFKNIDNLVFEIPIIVLTSEDDERSLSNYVMEQGAADTVIRGQFSRLVDAIEFGLIRQKLKTDARIKTEKTLSSSHDHNTNLQENSKTNIRAYNERHKQILRMFSGDYSVDSSDKVTLSD